MTNIKIADLETNLFEELDNADLMAVIGGTGNDGITIAESDIGGNTTVTVNQEGITTQMVGSSLFPGFSGSYNLPVFGLLR
ncbi:hypothetical protein [Nostoc commune]|uniref:hypothetical protein n=1 Tax=Nostoc commune TaxID=1178 RepID=UPI0018C61077|nr:hypothetical protein [Nostoc commune]MBG1264120.1 hypothetical protein [Nostoc commune BAE]